MKKYLLMLLCMLMAIPSMQAQEDKAKMREELQKFKIDFLAKEMGLSEKQKAEFTPIYNEYDEARRKAGAEVWRFEHEMKKKKDASESDYKKLSELQSKAREKDNEIVKNMDAKLEPILSAKQIYILHQAEGKFFDKMKEMRRKHKSDHPGKKKTSQLKTNDKFLAETFEISSEQ